MRYRLLVALPVLLALAGGCRDISTIVASTPPAPSPVRFGGEAATRLYELYDRLPDIANCDEGKLKVSEQMKALNYVNAIRTLHRLPLVGYRPEDDHAVAKSALIMAANDLLSHEPSSNLACWTQEGYDASSKSNLAIATFRGTGEALMTTEGMVDMFWKDSLVEDLGHRRWLLDPFLKYISFARVDRPAIGNARGVSAGTMKVVYPEHQDLRRSTVEYVAYPYHDYPTALYNSGLMMSFSALIDRLRPQNNAHVDYGDASVDIIGPGGVPAPIRDVRYDTYAYGLPNCLYWMADVQPGVRYIVRISGVRVNGASRSYDYWFALGRSIE